ncbi:MULTISPECIES: YciI family protein [unclassified Actinotalea]|uniref:YciI family protein n=1 Tax=unclassified Actinotalea TaxID=2638618 RepID=UPI001C70FEF0|nr:MULTISPECIES: YciI family protein [unclassified Actinotalea]
MRYVISVIDDTTGSATAAEMAAVDAFNDRLRADGHWVFAAGLGAPATAAVVDGRSGAEPLVTDGPFLESKEYLAGFWIVEAPSREVALELAAQGSRHCHRRVELRPLLGG